MTGTKAIAAALLIGLVFSIGGGPSAAMDVEQIAQSETVLEGGVSRGGLEQTDGDGRLIPQPHKKRKDVVPKLNLVTPTPDVAVPKRKPVVLNGSAARTDKVSTPNRYPTPKLLPRMGKLDKARPKARPLGGRTTITTGLPKSPPQPVVMLHGSDQVPWFAGRPPAGYDVSVPSNYPMNTLSGRINNRLSQKDKKNFEKGELTIVAFEGYRSGENSFTTTQIWVRPKGRLSNQEQSRRVNRVLRLAPQ